MKNYTVCQRKPTVYLQESFFILFCWSTFMFADLCRLNYNTYRGMFSGLICRILGLELIQVHEASFD
jgi:hypothetical protein